MNKTKVGIKFHSRMVCSKGHRAIVGLFDSLDAFPELQISLQFTCLEVWHSTKIFRMCEMLMGMEGNMSQDCKMLGMLIHLKLSHNFLTHKYFTYQFKSTQPMNCQNQSFWAVSGITISTSQAVSYCLTF